LSNCEIKTNKIIKYSNFIFTLKISHVSLIKMAGIYEFVNNWFVKWNLNPFYISCMWRVLENKLATKVNLEKREIVVESPLCSLCRVEVESNNHLFFECRFAWLVWGRCFAWLGVQFVSHNDPLLNFSQFRLCNVFALANEMWGVIWIAVVSEL